MNAILTAGVGIGLACTAWMYVVGFTGWYRDPSLAWVFLAGVIACEVVGLFLGLRRTAAEGRGYGAQIVAGTFMAIVAGVIIVIGSLIFTTVAFPDYFRELESAQREALIAGGRSEAEAARLVQEGAASATPMAQAMSGFIGTLITGIFASAAIAVFVRGRDDYVTPRR